MKVKNFMADTIIVLKESGETDSISIHDAAVLADWATKRKINASDRGCIKAYSLIREGADLILRQQALLSEKLKPGENNETVKIFNDDHLLSSTRRVVDDTYVGTRQTNDRTS